MVVLESIFGIFGNAVFAIVCGFALFGLLLTLYKLYRFVRPRRAKVESVAPSVGLVDRLKATMPQAVEPIDVKVSSLGDLRDFDYTGEVEIELTPNTPTKALGFEGKIIKGGIKFFKTAEMKKPTVTTAPEAVPAPPEIDELKKMLDRSGAQA